MAISVGVGHNQGSDPHKVGALACQNAFKKLGSDSADLVVVFSSVAYDQKKMIEGVRSVSGDAVLVGASTAGEITADGPAKKSVAVMAIKSDQIKFSASVGKGLKADSRKGGKDAAGGIKEQAGDALKVFMMMADGLSGNGSEVVRGALDVLGKHFPVVGGSAGDDAQYKQTYQYLNGDVFSDAVIGVGFSGDFKFAIGVNHGWVPVGPFMKVTKSEGAVVHELDGKPAIKIFEDYFGEEEAKKLKEKVLAEVALSYPLGLKVEGSDELLLRAPFFVDKNGSITCGGEIPEGAEVRLMVGSKEEAITAAKNAARRVVEQLGEQPKVVFMFNCHVRDKLFGERVREEITAMQEILGKNTPLIGFHTYAEQAPLGGEVRDIKKCNPALHNETVVLFGIAE